MKLLKGSLIALLIMMFLCYGTVTFLSFNKVEHKPVINCLSGQLLISCSYTEGDLLDGVTAFDEEDGDITEKIMVGNFTKFTQPGICQIKYWVFDSKGNYGEYLRNIKFFDYKSPKITLTEPLVFIKNSNSSERSLRNYLRGTDLLDGDVTKHIKIESSDVAYWASGTYKAAVSLHNTFGDSVELEIPIHILDNIYRGLEIKLIEPLVYIGQNEKIVPEEYIESVRREEDGQEISVKDCDIRIESETDYSTQGVHEIGYTIYGPDKTLYGKTWLTVVVGE